MIEHPWDAFDNETSWSGDEEEEAQEEVGVQVSIWREKPTEVAQKQGKEQTMKRKAQ